MDHNINENDKINKTYESSQHIHRDIGSDSVPHTHVPRYPVQSTRTNWGAILFVIVLIAAVAALTTYYA